MIKLEIYKWNDIYFLGDQNEIINTTPILVNKTKLNFQDCIKILEQCNAMMCGTFYFQNKEDVKQVINLIESYLVMNKLIE